MNVCLFVCVFVFVCIYVFIYASIDIYLRCLFGWTSPDWVRLILLFGLIIGVVCIAGSNYAVMHIYLLKYDNICTKI